jgi:hypothetical protein
MTVATLPEGCAVQRLTVSLHAVYPRLLPERI